MTPKQLQHIGISVDEFLDEAYDKICKRTGITLPECECYCGTPWMPHWFRSLISVKFNKSCKIHDVYYASLIIDNEDADFIFLDHMKLQAGRSIYWKCVAYSMFLKVRVFQFFSRDFIPYLKD